MWILNDSGKLNFPFSPRTRVKTVKDVKRGEKIAELLVEGKKGEELDAAIQEFDRTHSLRSSLDLRPQSLLGCIDGRHQHSYPMPTGSPSCSRRNPCVNAVASCR